MRVKYEYPQSAHEMAIIFAKHFSLSPDRDDPLILSHDRFDRFCESFCWYFGDRSPADNRCDIRRKINGATLAREWRSMTDIKPFRIETRNRGHDLVVRHNDAFAEAVVVAFPPHLRMEVESKQRLLRQIENSLPAGLTDPEIFMRLRARNRGLTRLAAEIQASTFRLQEECRAFDQDMLEFKRRMLPPPTDDVA